MKPASPVLGVKFSSSFIKRYKKTPEDFQHVEHLCHNENSVLSTEHFLVQYLPDHEPA